MHRNLIEPSLQGDGAHAIYPSGALIAAAFFGGGIGVTALATENARLRGRLRQDAPWLLAGAALSIVTLIVAVELVPASDANVAHDNARLAYRGIGFALWLALYHLHRREHRAMRMFGRKTPDVARGAFAAILLGWMVLRVFLAFWPVHGP